MKAFTLFMCCLTLVALAWIYRCGPVLPAAHRPVSPTGDPAVAEQQEKIVIARKVEVMFNRDESLVFGEQSGHVIVRRSGIWVEIRDADRLYVSTWDEVREILMTGVKDEGPAPFATGVVEKRKNGIVPAPQPRHDTDAEPSFDA